MCSWESKRLPNPLNRVRILAPLLSESSKPKAPEADKVPCHGAGSGWPGDRLQPCLNEFDSHRRLCLMANQVVFGVCWIARDRAKVEDQVQFLARTLFDAGARRYGNRLQPGRSGFDSHRRFLTDRLLVWTTSLPCESSELFPRRLVTTQSSTACWEYILTMRTLRYRASGRPEAA